MHVFTLTEYTGYFFQPSDIPTVIYPIFKGEGFFQYRVLLLKILSEIVIIFYIHSNGIPNALVV